MMATSQSIMNDKIAKVGSVNPWLVSVGWVGFEVQFQVGEEKVVVRVF